MNPEEVDFDCVPASPREVPWADRRRSRDCPGRRGPSPVGPGSSGSPEGVASGSQAFQRVLGCQDVPVRIFQRHKVFTGDVTCESDILRAFVIGPSGHFDLCSWSSIRQRGGVGVSINELEILPAFAITRRIKTLFQMMKFNPSSKTSADTCGLPAERKD